MDAFFISDLHLHPEDSLLNQRFSAFIDWIKQQSCKKLFILGDFFHAWPGDDGMDDWSKSIAQQLRSLKLQNIQVYFMHGNRDFLLGRKFLDQAGMLLLPDPYRIDLGNQAVLLSHGDRFCTRDKSHQRFRRLTRNRLFKFSFLHLPLSKRQLMVNAVREKSKQSNKTLEMMDIVNHSWLKGMRQYQAHILVHGHTHKPGEHPYLVGENKMLRFVLSDWDDIPQLLCYDKSKGFNFIQFNAL